MNTETAANLIRGGGVVAFPTETVYGLGADARNPDAVRQIFELKGRPSDNPLIVHLCQQSDVSEFAADIPEEAEILMEHYWPGPLTLIFQKRPDVPDAVSGGLPTIALRIPGHPLALELIRLTGPLAAPSANRSGRPSPTLPEHIREDFGDQVAILEGGQTEIGLESTVLDLSSRPFRILRPGAVTPEQIRQDTGIDIPEEPPDSHVEVSKSPGVRYTHYTPEATVMWFRKDLMPADQGLLLTHTEKPAGYPFHIHYHGDFNRFGRELYDRFRSADHRSLNYIWIEPLPENPSHPMIAALRNRIEKAIGRR